MDVLTIDVGGSHVKLLASTADEPRRFDSSDDLAPQQLVDKVRELADDWEYEVVSLGLPGLVGSDGPVEEPGNLGNGWVGFDFAAAFDCPVRVVNDAAMQALGGYEDGRMLFLGLGTGLGSALICERVIVPLELGSLPYHGSRSQETLAERLGKEGLRRHGRTLWEESVHKTVAVLHRAFSADYVVVGGGQADELKTLPTGARRGSNADAFTGGFRLWEEWIEPHDRRPSTAYRVVA